jgi:hypothetical protein
MLNRLGAVVVVALALVIQGAGAPTHYPGPHRLEAPVVALPETQSNESLCLSLELQGFLGFQFGNPAWFLDICEESTFAAAYAAHGSQNFSVGRFSAPGQDQVSYAFTWQATCGNSSDPAPAFHGCQWQETWTVDENNGSIAGPNFDHFVDNIDPGGPEGSTYAGPKHPLDANGFWVPAFVLLGVLGYVAWMRRGQAR